MSGLKHTQRLAAAAALTPPKPGMWLVSVRCIGGATPGSFSINYDGQSIAHFPAPTLGLGEYDVKWQIQGTQIPAASVAFNGGISAVELQYADRPGRGPDISAFRAIRVARTDGGAVTANITTNFDVAPAKPKFIVGYVSASAGRVVFPAVGSAVFQYEASAEEFVIEAMDCPDIPEANSLTVSGISDGAATFNFFVFY